MKIRLNDTTNADNSRIGQIIFKLKDSSGADITTGVNLSGHFASEFYQLPDYNTLITDNWSITKVANTVTPSLTQDVWTTILSVPAYATTIVIEDNYNGFFGSEDMKWPLW